jgi:hypothetical protein
LAEATTILREDYPITSIFSFAVGKKLSESIIFSSVGRPNRVAGGIFTSK